MALDKQAASNSLFGNIKRKESGVSPSSPKAAVLANHSPVIEKQENDDLSSFQAELDTLDRIVLPVTYQKKEELDRLAKQIMRNRSRHPLNHARKDKERITTTSLLRALVDIFLEKGGYNEVPGLYTEVEVKEWLKKILFQ